MELLSSYTPRVQCPENAKESISALLARFYAIRVGIQLCIRLLLSLHKENQKILKINRFCIKQIIARHWLQ